MLEAEESPALYIISMFFKGLGFLHLSCSIILPVLILSIDISHYFPFGYNLPLALLSLYVFLIEGFFAIISFAIAEGIKLFIQIEENTRLTAGILRSISIIDKGSAKKSYKIQEEVEESN